MAGKTDSEEWIREYSPYEKRRRTEEYFRVAKKAKAEDIARAAGCTERHAYRLIDELSNWLRLYKDGIYYVMLEEW